MVAADRDDGDLPPAEVDDVPVVEDVDLVIGVGHLVKPLLHFGAEGVFRVLRRLFAHPGLFPEGVAAGVVKVAVGIADHDRFVGDRLDHRPQVPFAVGGVDQHRLFLPDQQVAVEGPVVAEHPGIGEVLPLPVNISAFVDIIAQHVNHPFLSCRLKQALLGIGLDSLILDCRYSNPEYTKKIVSIYNDALKDRNDEELTKYKYQIMDFSHSYINKGSFIEGRLHEDKERKNEYEIA